MTASNACAVPEIRDAPARGACLAYRVFGDGPATVVAVPPIAQGRDAVICAIPTGADPGGYLAAAAAAEGGPPEVPGGPPHFVVGMYGQVTVES